MNKHTNKRALEALLLSQCGVSKNIEAKLGEIDKVSEFNVEYKIDLHRNNQAKAKENRSNLARHIQLISSLSVLFISALQ